MDRDTRIRIFLKSTPKTQLGESLADCVLYFILSFGLFAETETEDSELKSSFQKERR